MPRNFIIPVSNGILEAKHRQQIGSAIWLFLWLIDKCTKDVRSEDGIHFDGLVLGGKPITVQHISEQVGESPRSVRYHLDELEAHGYIHVTGRNGDAKSYAVLKSKKFQRVRAVLMGPGAGEQVDDRTEEQAPDDHGNPGKELPGSEREPRQEVAAPQAKSCQAPGNIFPPYKEEIPRTIQGEERKPLRGKTPRKPVDPRRADFIDDFYKYWEHTNPGAKFIFDSRDGKSFDRWLKEHPEIDRQQWRLILSNRARSPGPNDREGISHDAQMYTWIARAHQYLSGPKNRFWQPANQNQAGANGKEKSQIGIGNIGAALERRRAGRMGSAETGEATECVSGAAVIH